MSCDHFLKVVRFECSIPSISEMTMTGKGAANDFTASKQASVMVSSSSATFARILGRNSSTALALKGLLASERNRRWSGSSIKRMELIVVDIPDSLALDEIRPV